MQKFLFAIGGGVALVAVAGLAYYGYTPTPPPAPRDLTKVLPKEALNRMSEGELAMMRGETNVVPLVPQTATRRVAATDADTLSPTSTSAETSVRDPGRDHLTHEGLTVLLTSHRQEPLKGQIENGTDKPITCSYPAGTLFTNGVGDVALLRNFSVEVAAKSRADVFLPVAATSTANGVLEGKFVPHPGSVSALEPLLGRFALKEPLTPGAAQVAVLAVTENVPLDVVASYPQMRPRALETEEPRPFRVSNPDLIAALQFLRSTGFDTSKLAMLDDPQLQVMTLLDPESHTAAMSFFGVTEQTAWPFWKHQLLEGDPSLRHFALYGIARYYPEVALAMLPQWVRASGSFREYRVSAAWALALIEDPRAQKELKDLQAEFEGDVRLRQCLDRALRHWEASHQKVVSR